MKRIEQKHLDTLKTQLDSALDTVKRVVQERDNLQRRLNQAERQRTAALVALEMEF